MALILWKLIYSNELGYDNDDGWSHFDPSIDRLITAVAQALICSCEACPDQLFYLQDLWLYMTSFLLKEPLTHVLLIARFCPFVIVNIKAFLFWFLLTTCWWLTSLFSLSWFWFIVLNWLLKLYLFLIWISHFFFPNGHISNGTDIFFNPVKILADHFLIVLSVIA